MFLLLQVQWVEERRWPLIGTKANELHSGYGIVTIIRWRDNYLAWANEKVCECVCVCVSVSTILPLPKGVFVYDTALKYIITYVLFEEER